MISENQASISPSVASPYQRRPKRLLQNHDNVLYHIQLFLTLLSSIVAMLGVAWLRDGEVSEQYRALSLISALLIIVVYGWRGVYRRFTGRINGALRMARSWGLVVLLVVMAIFVCKLGDAFSRVVIVSWAIAGYVLQVIAYQISYQFSRSTDAASPVRVVVLGSQSLAEHLVESLRNNAWVPDRVVGIVDHDDKHIDTWKTDKAAYLGDFSRLEVIIEKYRITRVYIALPIGSAATIDNVCDRLSDLPVDIVWVPDIFALRLLNHSVREINGLPLISLSESPLMPASHAFAKSVMDKTIALIMLALLAPLMLAVALAVKLGSPGPVLFRQKRHGWDGRVIDVWKFRSMVVHQDHGVTQATRADSRITRVGRFIRRTSIDELPQLFNVLQGTMSLVGPRPHAIEHNDLYSNKIRSYMLRHRTKPGLTGWAQVNGMRGETDTLEKMLRRVELDLDYINRWSIWLDVKILIKTPFSLFSDNAY